MRRFFRGFVIFSLLAVIAAGGVLYGEKCREADHLLDELTALRLQNETDAASAARSLSDALGELRTGLRKLSAAGTPDATARLFAEVRRLSDRAGGALGTMNLSHVDGAALGQFLTRTGDYVDTLLRSVQGGTMLSEPTRHSSMRSIHSLRRCRMCLTSAFRSARCQMKPFRRTDTIRRPSRAAFRRTRLSSTAAYTAKRAKRPSRAACRIASFRRRKRIALFVPHGPIRIGSLPDDARVP